MTAGTNWLDILEGRATLSGVVPPFAAGSLSVPHLAEVEAQAEQSRQQHYPEAPSRLPAIFAFGDFASVKHASQRYGWSLDTVREFFADPLIDFACADMEFVSTARAAAERGLVVREPHDYWERYWRGDEHPAQIVVDCSNSECRKPPEIWERPYSAAIWEWIVYGQLRLLG